jgi:dihydrofolate reductase
MPHNLIDEYVLQIHPLVLGSGSRLFVDGPFATLRLIDTKTTTTGVVIATYQPAESAAVETEAGAAAVSSRRNTR